MINRLSSFDVEYLFVSSRAPTRRREIVFVNRDKNQASLGRKAIPNNPPTCYNPQLTNHEVERLEETRESTYSRNCSVKFFDGSLEFDNKRLARQDYLWGLESYTDADC